MYQYHVLPNGMRIVHRDSNGDVAYCGVAVLAGSACESPEQYGLAHFVEHTLFKGTRKRKSFHIINRMERIGGELNAYTSKEETMIYSLFPAGYYSRAVELLADLVCNSVFPESQLAKEKEVVLDELDSYLDMPSEAVYDDFEDLFFKGSPLAHNILGTQESVLALTGRDCIEFLDKYYVPANMVFFSYGNITFHKLCALVERYFGGIARNNAVQHISNAPHPVPGPFHKHVSIDSHQSHTIYGAHTQGMQGEHKYAMALLNNIIGGPGMNSLLNIALREKKGYVYTVESSITNYSGTGIFSIYFGCDHKHVAPCLRIIGNTLTGMAETPLSPQKLAMAKRQYTGQLLVATDNKENVALSMGKSMLYFNHMDSIEHTCAKIEAVTAEQLRDAAALLIPEMASTLTFGE